MADTFTKEQVDAAVAKATEGLLTQDKVDTVVKERLAREQAKYADYDSLRQFKTEHEKQLDAVKTKELEDQKKYEELKNGWVKKEEEYKGIIVKKDSELTDMRVGSALMTEVVAQNAYAEETMALIKSQAVFNPADGSIKIKGKDANNVDILDSVQEGVKKFLTGRPHLVKAARPGGGGTGAGAGAGGSGAGAGAEDLNALNAQLQAAMNSGDRKKINEIKTKISAIQGAKNVVL